MKPRCASGLLSVFPTRNSRHDSRRPRTSPSLEGDWFGIRGVVAWTRPQRVLVGLHFTDIPEETEKRLEAVLRFLAGFVA